MSIVPNNATLCAVGCPGRGCPQCGGKGWYVSQRQRRLDVNLYAACDMLRRVMEALDHEIEGNGQVPFDPDEIRAFLASHETEHEKPDSAC